MLRRSVVSVKLVVGDYMRFEETEVEPRYGHRRVFKYQGSVWLRVTWRKQDKKTRRM